MKRLLLSAVSLIGLVLATWASQSAPSTATPSEPIPFAVGVIQPRISDDGEQLAVSYQGAIWRLHRMGGVMTRLTSGTGFDIEPAWSSDGQLIAYVNSLRMGEGALQVIEAESGKTVPLPAPVQVLDIVSYAKLQFHPDGRLLGNFRIGGRDQGLALLDLKTGKAQTVLKPGRQMPRFALSKDGRWVVHTASMDVDGQQWGNDGPQGDVFNVGTWHVVTRSRLGRSLARPSRLTRTA